MRNELVWAYAKFYHREIKKLQNKPDLDKLKSMSKLLVCLSFVFSFFILGYFQPILALSDCKTAGINYTLNQQTPVPEKLDSITFTFKTTKGSGFMDPGEWSLNSASTSLTQSGPVELKIEKKNDDGPFKNGDHVLELKKNNQAQCTVTYKVGYTYDQCQLSIKPSSPTTVDPIAVTINHAPTGKYHLHGGTQSISNMLELYQHKDIIEIGADSNGNGYVEISQPLQLPPGSIQLELIQSSDFNHPLGEIFCKLQTSIQVIGGATPRPLPTLGPSPTPGGPGNQTGGCTGNNCTSAAGESCLNGAGIRTAIGCIPTEPSTLIQSFLKVAISAGGGIALLLMIYGTFQMITSAGNPDGVKKGHEQITSAVIGLLFIIFAVMLLKIIGVDILQIPGFSPT